MNLPSEYIENMKSLLKEEYYDYCESMNEVPNHGLRVNRLKLSADRFKEIFPYEIKKIPYIDNGYIYDESINPAKDVYYHAGLYYLQEPSAMLPANRLPIEENDRVLDLCAAPGGKATELAGKLGGSGILYANDISASRALALLKNLELSGAHNIYVTAETPENLSNKFPEYFDKILCDVPCSGEGMFRKDPSLINSWMEKGPEYYQPIQRSIIDSAYKMLKPGGMLMYSTCTFSPLEDEDNIQYLLDKYADLELADIDWYEGFSSGLKGLDKCVRVFPHRMSGEGHFLALLRKKESDTQVVTKDRISIEKSQIKKIVSKNKKEILEYRLPAFKDNGYREGIRYIRTGLLLNDSQAYAMTLDKDNYDLFIDLNYDDIRVVKYLKGETIFLNENEFVKKGLVLILVNGYALGFAKHDGSGKLKNQYNKGWRMG